MLGRLFRREPKGGDIPAALYGAIVARARDPVLYRDFGVADTVAGRLEMVIFHLALGLRVIFRLGEAERSFGQAVFDLFCVDMDRSLRELGIGDLAVPKRMKRIGEAYYGRAAAYDAALDAGDRTALTAAVVRNVFEGREAVAAGAMADYMMAADRALAAGAAELLSGRFPIPDPSAFIAATSTP